MNATMEKFGWPATRLREFDHWAVLLRPAQVTLGSMVLAAKSDATAFGDLSVEAFAELKQATAEIESALTRFVAYQKINYLMLMMVDPHVHFHVIPRYDGAREWQGQAFPDEGWPKTPALGAPIELSAEQRDALIVAIKDHWPRGDGESE